MPRPHGRLGEDVCAHTHNFIRESGPSFLVFHGLCVCSWSEDDRADEEAKAVCANMTPNDP